MFTIKEKFNGKTLNFIFRLTPLKSLNFVLENMD